MDELEDCPRIAGKFANDESFEARLEKPESEDFYAECSAMRDDIDLNGHVNNTVFMAWTAEALPQEFSKDKTPSKVAINFLEEIAPKTKVRSVFQAVSNKSLHSIIRESDQRECARVNIEWESILS